MTSPKASARSSRESRAAKATPKPGEELPFWRRKTLKEMSKAEWESLCDGCAKCCLIKLEYDDTGEIDHTDIACKLLDLGTCRCSDYPHRQAKVPDCLTLNPRRVRQLRWLPATCAYRLVAEGKDLYWWHPLVSGDPETVHEAGISVRGRVVSEEGAGKPEDHIIDWVD